MTDPAILPSSSSHYARLRADEELIGIMTKAVNELGLEWSPLRSHLAAGWTSVFSWGAIKPPSQRSSPFYPEVHTSSRYYGTPPTFLASVLLLQLLSHPLMALKKKDTSTCLLWTSLPAHIYRMEDEGKPSVQAVQSHICTCWTCLLGCWTSGFSASLDGCAPGLPG